MSNDTGHREDCAVTTLVDLISWMASEHKVR